MISIESILEPHLTYHRQDLEPIQTTWRVATELPTRRYQITTVLTNKIHAESHGSRESHHVNYILDLEYKLKFNEPWPTHGRNTIASFVLVGNCRTQGLRKYQGKSRQTTNRNLSFSNGIYVWNTKTYCQKCRGSEAPQQVVATLTISRSDVFCSGVSWAVGPSVDMFLS